VRTGKPALRAGYSLATINHALTVVSQFYAFHAHAGRGPVVNPVPERPDRRAAGRVVVGRSTAAGGTRRLSPLVGAALGSNLDGRCHLPTTGIGP
jgi:hypothetical protein